MSPYMSATFCANRSNRLVGFPDFCIFNPYPPRQMPPWSHCANFIFGPLPFLDEYACGWVSVCQIWSRSDRRQRRKIVPYRCIWCLEAFKCVQFNLRKPSACRKVLSQREDISDQLELYRHKTNVRLVCFGIAISANYSDHCFGKPLRGRKLHCGW